IGGQFYASADEMSQKVTCNGGICTYGTGCGASADAQSCLQAVSDYRDAKAASMAGGALCGREIECRNLLDMASKDSTYDCGTTGTTTQKSIAVCSKYAKNNGIDLASLYDRSTSASSNNNSGNGNSQSAHVARRIYTVEEARQAVEAAGTDTVNFRIRYK
ncbi:MAG: hypothetical protein IKR60_00505, partial [Alphaproteobacteria bacterium]|nr:hypothetical protein [Alphaproteobacteria bacterium]